MNKQDTSFLANRTYLKDDVSNISLNICSQNTKNDKNKNIVSTDPNHIQISTKDYQQKAYLRMTNRYSKNNGDITGSSSTFSSNLNPKIFTRSHNKAPVTTTATRPLQFYMYPTNNSSMSPENNNKSNIVSTPHQNMATIMHNNFNISSNSQSIDTFLMQNGHEHNNENFDSSNGNIFSNVPPLNQFSNTNLYANNNNNNNNNLIRGKIINNSTVIQNGKIITSTPANTINLKQKRAQQHFQRMKQQQEEQQHHFFPPQMVTMINYPKQKHSYVNANGIVSNIDNNPDGATSYIDSKLSSTPMFVNNAKNNSTVPINNMAIDTASEVVATEEEYKMMLLNILSGSDDDNKNNDYLSYISKKLLNPPSNFNIDFIIDEEGHTTLHWAVSMGYLPFVRILLYNLKSDPLICNSKGFNCITKACFYNNCFKNQSFTEFLYLMPQCLITPDRNGRLPLHYLMDLSVNKNKDPKIIEHYLQCILQVLATPFPQTLPNGEQVMITLLSTVLNHQDIMGNTPLHLAALNMNIAMCENLLNIGANRSVVNSEGETMDSILTRYQNMFSKSDDNNSQMSLSAPARTTKNNSNNDGTKNSSTDIQPSNINLANRHESDTEYGITKKTDNIIKINKHGLTNFKSTNGAREVLPRSHSSISSSVNINNNANDNSLNTKVRKRNRTNSVIEIHSSNRLETVDEIPKEKSMTPNLFLHQANQNTINNNNTNITAPVSSSTGSDVAKGNGDYGNKAGIGDKIIKKENNSKGSIHRDNVDDELLVEPISVNINASLSMDQNGDNINNDHLLSNAVVTASNTNANISILKYNEEAFNMTGVNKLHAEPNQNLNGVFIGNSFANINTAAAANNISLNKGDGMLLLSPQLPSRQLSSMSNTKGLIGKKIESQTLNKTFELSQTFNNFRVQLESLYLGRLEKIAIMEEKLEMLNQSIEHHKNFLIKLNKEPQEDLIKQEKILGYNYTRYLSALEKNQALNLAISVEEEERKIEPDMKNGIKTLEDSVADTNDKSKDQDVVSKSEVLDEKLSLIKLCIKLTVRQLKRRQTVNEICENKGLLNNEKLFKYRRLIGRSIQDIDSKLDDIERDLRENEEEEIGV
ncbi:uncharacterized protein SCODWIG_02026 [Saccharomycodes ludwigii]|uniref:Uncharacterized protein n=1 Tax=Saccharomycodes ludwigii TaxID=36035 RepID=A0A376B6E6_9ASCO|nr:uncharacterized protein SCODWIG_02026 [Saccharomycodes ludwigii]